MGIVRKIIHLLEDNNISGFNSSRVIDMSKNRVTILNMTFKNKHEREAAKEILLKEKDFFNVIKLNKSYLEHTLLIEIMTSKEARKNKLNELLDYE